MRQKALTPVEGQNTIFRLFLPLLGSKIAATAVFLFRDIRIYGTKSAQTTGKHGPGPFAILIFFSKILAKYFLIYRDFGDFLVLDYNMGPQDNILREMCF